VSVPWRPAGQQSALTGFAVQLDEFEGPLDLLLHLIDKQGLDITGVSVLDVTDQFVNYARELDDQFADAASEFLLVGSQLALLKSRALLPQDEHEVDEEETVEDLAARLRVYAAFKAVAAELDKRLSSGASSLIRVAAPVIAQPPVERGAGDLDVLVGAIEEMLVTHRRGGRVFNPPAFRYRVSDKVRELSARIRRDGSLEFATVAAECTDRAELIVTFVAILYLLQRREVRVEQDVLFGPIHLQAREPDG
jgi:segregation and condensation protein A